MFNRALWVKGESRETVLWAPFRAEWGSCEAKSPSWWLSLRELTCLSHTRRTPFFQPVCVPYILLYWPSQPLLKDTSLLALSWSSFCWLNSFTIDADGLPTNSLWGGRRWLVGASTPVHWAVKAKATSYLVALKNTCSSCVNDCDFSPWEIVTWPATPCSPFSLAWLFHWKGSPSSHRHSLCLSHPGEWHHRQAVSSYCQVSPFIVRWGDIY